MPQTAAYPGELIEVDVSPYDEQSYLTSENFRMLAISDNEVNTLQCVFNDMSYIVLMVALIF